MPNIIHFKINPLRTTLVFIAMIIAILGLFNRIAAVSASSIHQSFTVFNSTAIKPSVLLYQ